MKILQPCIFVLAFALTDGCWANDSVGHIYRGDPQSAGGIIFKKTNDISMEKEVLTISPNLIRVEYEFLNKTAKPIREEILFPMPYYNFIGKGCGNTYTGKLEDFKLWVDGTEMPTLRHVQAKKFSGEDVTNLFHKLGFTDDDIANFGGTESATRGCGPEGELSNPLQAPPIIAKNIDTLFDEDLVVDKERAYPNWQVSNVYSWDLDFPPGHIVRVVHEYKPLIFSWMKFRTTNRNALAGFNEPYCTDDGTFRVAQDINKRTKSPFGVGILNYVLTTGANWSGPIKDFTLNLRKENENQVFSLCFDGHFVKSDSLTLTSHIHNFVPTKDIALLYLYPISDISPESKDEDIPISVTVSDEVKKQLNQMSATGQKGARQLIMTGNKFAPNQFDQSAMGTGEDGSPNISFEPDFEAVRIEQGEDVKIGHREVCPQVSLSSAQFDKEETVLTYRSKIVGLYLDKLWPVGQGGKHLGFSNFSYDISDSGKFYEVKITLDSDNKIASVAPQDNFYTYAYTYEIEHLKDAIDSNAIPKEEQHIRDLDSRKRIEVIKKHAEKICK